MAVRGVRFARRLPGSGGGVGAEFSGAHLFAEEVKNEIRQRLQKAGRAAFETAKDLTPIDRGYLYNSWALGIDAPIHRDMEEAGEGYIENLSRVRADSTLYLTNEKPYASYINDGTSKIAAHQMLENALNAAWDEL